VLDDDIAKTIFAEDFANVVTRICGFDDSSEERKKCVVFVVLFVLPFHANCAKIRTTR
jgi:hypothetical protein